MGEGRKPPGHGAKIGRKAEALVAALLTEPTQEAAALKAGVSDRTARKWMRRPEFVSAYRAARRRLVELAIGKIQRATAEAAETLTASLKAPRASSRIRAADLILTRAERGMEMLDLAERVEALEAAVKNGRR